MFVYDIYSSKILCYKHVIIIRRFQFCLILLLLNDAMFTCLLTTFLLPKKIIIFICELRTCVRIVNYTYVSFNVMLELECISEL